MLGIHCQIEGGISNTHFLDIYLICPKKNHIQNPHGVKIKQIIFQWRKHNYRKLQLQKSLLFYCILKSNVIVLTASMRNCGSFIQLHSLLFQLRDESLDQVKENIFSVTGSESAAYLILGSVISLQILSSFKTQNVKSHSHRFKEINSYHNVFQNSLLYTYRMFK